MLQHMPPDMAIMMPYRDPAGGQRIAIADSRPLEDLRAFDRPGADDHLAIAIHAERPAFAMEQFDREHQPALDAAGQAGIKDAEALADAGRLNRKGWRWPMYKGLIEHAAGQGWPIVAANLLTLARHLIPA